MQKSRPCETGGSGAGLWLALPTEPEHHLTNQKFTTAVRLRMSLDAFQKEANRNITCSHQGGQRSGNRICQAHLDITGLNTLLCKLGGHVVTRHNRIRDLLGKLLQAITAATVSVEQHSGLDTDQYRPDINFLDHNSRQHHIDVEITTPHPRALSGSPSIQRTGSLIETEESKKRRRYPNVSLLPAVASHLGRFGQGFQRIIRMVNRQADASERSMAIARFYHDIGVELQRANVVLLGSAGRII